MADSTEGGSHLEVLKEVNSRKFYHINSGLTQLIKDAENVQRAYLAEGKLERGSPGDNIVTEVITLMRELVDESKLIRPEGKPPPRRGAVAAEASRKGPSKRELFS